MALNRRTLIQATLALAATGHAQSAAAVGVVALHGKRGSPDASPNAEVTARLRAAGIPTLAPTLPWSRSRYLSGTWSTAMEEVGASVAQMKAKAGRVVLLGHSMGCPAAMSYAAGHGDVAGLVLASPGHNPFGYYKNTPKIRDSVDRARAMVQAGKGAEKATFYDNNQGDVFTVSVSAEQYLSYFDPAGPCDMRNTAAQITVPVLWIAGDADRVTQWGAPIAARLVHGDKSRILAVSGTHGSAPVVAAGEIVQWVKAV